MTSVKYPPALSPSSSVISLSTSPLHSLYRLCLNNGDISTETHLELSPLALSAGYTHRCRGFWMVESTQSDSDWESACIRSGNSYFLFREDIIFPFHLSEEALHWQVPSFFVRFNFVPAPAAVQIAIRHPRHYSSVMWKKGLTSPLMQTAASTSSPTSATQLHFTGSLKDLLCWLICFPPMYFWLQFSSLCNIWRELALAFSIHMYPNSSCSAIGYYHTNYDLILLQFFSTAYRHFKNFGSFFKTLHTNPRIAHTKCKMPHISCKMNHCIQNITNTSQKQTFANTFAKILIPVRFFCVCVT